MTGIDWLDLYFLIFAETLSWITRSSTPCWCNPSWQDLWQKQCYRQLWPHDPCINLNKSLIAWMYWFICSFTSKSQCFWACGYSALRDWPNKWVKKKNALYCSDEAALLCQVLHQLHWVVAESKMWCGFTLVGNNHRLLNRHSSLIWLN